MKTVVDARLIEVGSEIAGLSGGTTQPIATFEGPTGGSDFSVPISQEQARELAPMLYRWCRITIELSGIESTESR